MKLGVLKEFLDTQVKEHPELLKFDVVIPVSGRNIGPLAHVDIEGVNMGFDWDTGLVILWPARKLNVNS